MEITKPEFHLEAPFGIDRDIWRDMAIGAGAMLVLVVLKMVSPLFTLGMPVSVGDTQTFFINVFLASFGEEAFFRGILPFGIMKLLYVFRLYKFGNFWVVNTIQSGCFSIFHKVAYGVGYQTAFVGAGTIGFIFGILVAVTHSLVSSMLPHMGLNGSNYIIDNQVLSLGGF